MPSANVGQSITLIGEGFNASTRVEFTSFNGNSPQFGLSEHEIIPTSVAADGTSLVVVVPSDAVTGRVRINEEPSGLILQIVPTLTDIDLSGTIFDDGSTITLTGSGFIEGAMDVVIGSGINQQTIEDQWDFAGTDVFNSGSIVDGAANFGLPGNPPPGPIKVRTLGGTSTTFAITFTGVAAGTVATRGTPTNPAVASTNVRDAITLTGSGFDMTTEVVFVTQTSSSSNADIRSYEVVTPTALGPGGTSLTVIVPDNAATGNLRIVGAAGEFFLQIVPTIVQVITPSPFGTGGSMQLKGSGFVVGDVTGFLGGTKLLDTGPFIGPDASNASISAGFDRSDYDALVFQIPPGAGVSTIKVRTSGGEATLSVVASIQSVALSGTAANAGVPSANPGQTIRILGSGITLSTEIICQTIDVLGGLSNVVLQPDLVSVNGTLAEIRVPDNAVTGTIQVVGAAGVFPLQIVPTLELIEPFAGGQVRLLGSGFSEGASLSVNFNGVVVTDTGANIDVSNSNRFLANDTILMNIPGGGTSPVTVTTAGGTSAAVSIANDDPVSISGMVSMAIFPASSGADAGRLAVMDNATGTPIRILDPLTLALVRSLVTPGAAGNQLGITFLTSAVTVQDAVRGNVLVPSGSLVVVNGSDSPDRIYYLNPAGAGTVLADVALGGLSPVDEDGAMSVAYHAGRGTLFVLRGSSSLITEINPATGAAIQSFHNYLGNGFNTGSITVHPTRNTIVWAGPSSSLLELDPDTGRVVGPYDPISNTQLSIVDLRQQGVNYQSSGEVTGLAFNASGQLLSSIVTGRILTLTLPGAPTGIVLATGALATGVDGTAWDALQPAANARQRIRILGSGYDHFTRVIFERVTSAGDRGFISVRADVVSADGTAIEVVVPDEAVTGQVRIAGAPGNGLYLQITPTIRAILPADTNFNFDDPVEGIRWGMLGSGLIEGGTRVQFGGVWMDEDSSSALLDVVDIGGTGYSRLDGRLDLNIPERALAGPVRVETAGGFFVVNSIPIRVQQAVGLTGIVAEALEGTPTNATLASANAGQIITLTGFGFNTTTSIIFRGVALDGTRGLIVVHPTSVATGGTSLTVVVPALAVTGPVAIAGSTTNVDLQVVPTLHGIQVGALTPGSAIRLIGTGIPEGGASPGEGVTYTVGAASITDTSAAVGPKVQSALAAAVVIDLTVPGGATGLTVQVTTAGGTARLVLADLVSVTIAAEAQGIAAVDGVGATLATATDLTVAPYRLLTVTGRINVGSDVDLYRLAGAETGGFLTVSVTGAQSSNARFIVFDETGVALTTAVGSLTRFVLAPAATYYLGYSGFPNTSYNPVDGTGTVTSSLPGDYTLTIKYAGPGVTSLNAITATATSGTPGTAGMPSANVGQSITLAGEGFNASTRVEFTSINGNSPQFGLQEHEVIPTSVAADGTSLVVVVPSDAVTGRVRINEEPAGLILQIVPTLTDIDLSGAIFDDGNTITLTGSGFIEGAMDVVIGSGINQQTIEDQWDFAGTDVFNSGSIVDGAANFGLPGNPPPGPIKVRTLGGTSTTFAITFTGVAAGTVATRGTPTNPAVASTNVRDAITLTGSGFDMTTEVVFVTQTSSSSNADIRSFEVVTPTAVGPGGTSLTVIVPDNAATGNLRVVGAAGEFFLQIVPTIVQVITPASFNTTGTITIQGSGFIENDVRITLGPTALLDTGPFIGPDVFNTNITFAGKDRTDNDGISLQIPPGAASGPWEVKTAGGTARFGVVVDLGVVIHETRTGRTVAPGEQEIFIAGAAVTGWLDWEVHYTSNTATLQVLNVDGSAATLVDFITNGPNVLLRVAATAGQIFFLQTNGVGAVAAYTVEATNHDRFDDPVGPQSGAFAGHYGVDPDGRNETVLVATDFTPAVYVLERLSIPNLDTDWFTWNVQATGKLNVGVLFSLTTGGTLAFRMYADSNANGILDAGEQAAPVAVSAPSVDGARVSGIAAARGQRFWVQVFGVTANDKNIYDMTFSNLDLVDAGLLAGHPANNDTKPNAVDLGTGVSWSSLTVSDDLTMHLTTDQDWFRFTTRVPGSLQVLVDLDHPELGQVIAQVVDAGSGAGLTLLEFEDSGHRIRFLFAPVAKDQQLLIQFTGAPNAYRFSMQNNDRFEDDPTMD